MMQQYLKELEQEPFDAEEFVERLAWRTIAETKEGGKEEFNPILLHDSFVQAIKDLTLLQERQQKKCERLEARVQDDEAIFRKEIHSLQDSNKVAVDTFQELDGKINIVAAKVLHLGDQLDSINGPRSRVVEAQRLMTHLNEFLTPRSFSSTSISLFSDSSRIDEAADIIHKLQVIAQDLPSPRFDSVINRIKSQYDEVERALIEEFCNAQRKNDLKRMKQTANVLSQFKSYSECIDAFIEQSQAGCLLNKDVFGHLLILCKHNYQVIKEVFSHPEQVMTKFILNMYQLQLGKYIEEKLSSKVDTYNYLKILYDLYSKTINLSNELATLNTGSDKNLLNKLTANVFNKYIESYIRLEIQCLDTRASDTLHKYFESKNHQKRQIQSGGFQELRRDIQAVIGTRTNLNIAQIEDYGGETFLSEELAISILQDTKLAFQRCHLLSKPEEKAENACQILDKLLKYLLIEHIDYAIHLGLQAIPVVEGARTPPTFYFFTVIHQSNNIIHLLEKQYTDMVVPLVKNTDKYGECARMKRNIMEDIERKVNIGFERCLNAVVNWVRLYLQAEQRKTDFKPDTDDIDTVASPACKGVIQYINNIIAQIKNTLDGNNVNAVLQELGIKLHKVIYEHLLQFQYSTTGAMVAICDLNEYRSCTKNLGPLATKLFEKLHALCNLLLVKPENLEQVREDSLVDLEASVVNNFIQLRSDFKSQKQILRV
ncbi:hypothetical protein Trydic_g2098 [Trypoxylus dichotomus]